LTLIFDANFISPEQAYNYALSRSYRFTPEMVGVIKEASIYAYLYAMDILEHRWPEAEKVIKTDPQAAYLYAIDVIRGRWQEAEDVIQKDGGFWNNYRSNLQHLEYTEEVKLGWLKTEGVTRNLLGVLAFVGMERQVQNFLLGHNFALYRFILDYQKIDCSTDFQLRVLKDNLMFLFKMRNPSPEAQEYFIQQRPDLIDKIPGLLPELKEKYSHEIELVNVDI
jgi:hypothetical protein